MTVMAVKHAIAVAVAGMCIIDFVDFIMGQWNLRDMCYSLIFLSFIVLRRDGQGQQLRKIQVTAGSVIA